MLDENSIIELPISQAYDGGDPAVPYNLVNVKAEAGNCSKPATRYYQSPTNEPMVLMGYVEQQLILAEAVVRGRIQGDDKTYYESAVKASFEFYRQYATNVSDYLTPEAADKYLQDENVAYTNSLSTGKKIERIAIQKYNADKKFKIVQFTDVHWVPGNKASETAAERMNEVLDAEKPDFVIYTGDIVFGKPAGEALTKALEPVISHRLPFAVTWGNHDDEQDMNRAQLSEYIKDMPGNLTSTVKGISGVSNYILSLKSSDGRKDAAVIYVFDSHAYSPLKQVKGYDWVKPDQIGWYIKNSSAYTENNDGKPVPSIAFFHIPFPEYNEAAQDENALLIGTRKGKACAPQINTGLFAAMLNAGDIMATFVGHDHVNDYVVDWKGILLCYGRFTGGHTVYHDIPGGNGARVIELTEGKRSLTPMWLLTCSIYATNHKLSYRPNAHGVSSHIRKV